MRLKPTPLVETSLVFSIAWLISLILSIFDTNDFNKALTQNSNMSLVFLLSSYFLWGITGLAVRRKSHLVRFFANLTVTSIVALGTYAVLSGLASNAKGIDPALVAKALTSLVGLSTIYFFASAIAAGLTFFVLTRPKKQKK